eukprot:6777732-Alexandrium_andersonii.AAC.1
MGHEVVDGYVVPQAPSVLCPALAECPAERPLCALPRSCPGAPAAGLEAVQRARRSKGDPLQ